MSNKFSNKRWSLLDSSSTIVMRRHHCIYNCHTLQLRCNQTELTHYFNGCAHKFKCVKNHSYALFYNWFLFQFLFLLAMIFSFEIGTAVAIYTRNSHLNETLDNNFKQILTNHTENVDLWSSVQSKVWKNCRWNFQIATWTNFFSVQMKCCGINSPDDWINELNTLILPSSCCPNSTNTEDDCIKENASQHGCKPILMDHMKRLTTILSGVGLGIGWFQVWWFVVLHQTIWSTISLISIYFLSTDCCHWLCLLCVFCISQKLCTIHWTTYLKRYLYIIYALIWREN